MNKNPLTPHGQRARTLFAERGYELTPDEMARASVALAMQIEGEVVEVCRDAAHRRVMFCMMEGRPNYSLCIDCVQDGRSGCVI